MSSISDPVYSTQHAARQTYHDNLVFYPKERQAVSVFIDLNSVFRNLASVIKAIASSVITAVGVAISAIMGGVAGLPIGGSTAYLAGKRGKVALLNKDVEGGVTNSLFGTFGASYAGVSGVLAAEGVLLLKNAAIPAALTTAFFALGIAMNAPLALYSTYGLGAAFKFRNEFNQAIVENRASEWLKKQVTLDDAELAEIYTQFGQNADAEIAKRLNQKWSAFEFRTSPDCATQVREALINQGKISPALITEVQKANFKARVKHFILLLIALIGIIAFVAMIHMSPALCSILFAAGSGVWLFVDHSNLHNYVGDKLWNLYSEEKKPNLTCKV
jgi:hypothetical protein